MPVHRFASGPEENDTDVLDRAVQAVEAKGEEIVHVLPWVAWPVGEIVLVTRKVRKTETRRQA